MTLTDALTRLDFERLSGYISEALAYSGDTHDPEDVWAGIAEGRFQLWPGNDSVVVTEMLQYPKRRVLHVFLAAGNLPELKQMYPVIERWARELGCSRVSLAGRPGWERTFLREEGWTPRWSVMAKEI
jgi:hypothetical protein